MSYQTLDDSLEDAQPVELYRFENAEEIFTYTSGQVPVAFGGKTYDPIPLMSTEPSVTSTDARGNLQITLPITNELAARYVATVPASIDKLTIYRFHTTDTPTPEVIVTFIGTVASCTFSGETAKLTCEQGSSVLNRIFPKQSTRGNCNHVLYDGGCQVSDSQFKLAGVVTAIAADGFSIQLDTGDSIVLATGLKLSAQLADDATYFNAGYIRRGGIEYRAVQTMNDLGGNVVAIALLIPFQTIALGVALDLFAGCDHILATCIAKFDNVDRYGGFPFVPEKNPFTAGID